MKFYSYDYVLSQISQQNWAMVAISTLLILVTGVFAFKAYKDRHDTKFRELLYHFYFNFGGYCPYCYQQFPN